MNPMTPFKMLFRPCAVRRRRQPGIAAALAGLAWPLLALLAPAVGAQTPFSYAGALQTYTVPAGAGGVQDDDLQVIVVEKN